MGKIRTGFTEYEETYNYSENFINDVDLLIYKIYKKWSLYEDYEEFKSSCWTKVVSSLKWYDSEGGREYGKLSPFIHQVIWNEATRIYSKHKKMSDIDIGDYIQSTNCSPNVANGNTDQDDLILRDRICSFAQRAFVMGIYIDQKKLYKNYLCENLTPLVKAFMWYSIVSIDKNKGIGFKYAG